MRFKAKLAPEQVSLLHSLIVPMTRLGGGSGEGGGGGTQSAFARNGTILYLDSDHVRLSCKGRTSDTDGMSCFAELAAVGFHSIFLDRRIESAAPNNAIVMELDLAQLRMALKSVMSDTSTASASNTANSTVGSNNASFVQGGIHGAAAALEVQYTVLKLAKRQNIPCLCIDACSSGGGGNTAWIQVHHAIPVRIVRHSEMPSHMPPQISLPDVQLELNHHQHHLRIVVDRLKKQSSPTVYLEGSMKGALTVRSHTDGCAALQTYFGQLTPRLDNCSERTDASTIRQVKVDTKKLATALAWQQQQPSQLSQSMVQSALLCLVENEMLVVHVNLNPENVGFFTYYVPVHFLSPDPCED
jgi:HUS1 checkpoint protein